MITTAVLILSPDALLMRLVDLEHWTLVFWRSGMMSITLGVALIAIYRGRTGEAFRDIGIPGAVICVVHAYTSISFVFAILHTAVANVFIIVSAAPLFAAILSRIVLREDVLPRTWAAIVFAIVGIAIVFWGGAGQGTLKGDGAALTTAVSLAVTFILVRRSRHINMVPATAIAGLIAATVCAVFAASLSVTGRDIMLLMLMGLFVLPVSFALITLAPRYLPAPEVGLVLLLETVLGPLWVWLALGERVSDLIILGGAVVVSTLVVHSALQLRDRA